VKLVCLFKNPGRSQTCSHTVETLDMPHRRPSSFPVHNRRYVTASIYVFALITAAMTQYPECAPAESLMTWKRDGAVKLRMTETGPGSEPPTTVMQAFKETVTRVPHKTALGKNIVLLF